MRVIEIIKGFGIGGAEASISNRLRFAPPEVSTRVVIVGNARSVKSQSLEGFATVDTLQDRTTTSQVMALVEMKDPDVILVHNPMVALRYLPAVLRGQRRVVIVAHNSRLSDSLIRDRALRLPMRRINSKVAGHIAVSQAAARGPWCAGSRSVIVAPLGSMVTIDPTTYASPWPEGCRVKCLSLGRLSKPKQVLKLADSVIRLGNLFRSEGAHLAIVGSGVQEKAISRKLEAADVGDIISLHPATVTPGPYFQEADWLIVSSRYEGGPLTAYESAIVGTGIAGTPAGIMPELLSEYPDGLLAEGHSSRDLRDLLESVLRVGATTVQARAVRTQVGEHWQSSNLTPKFYEALEVLTWGGQ